VWALDRAAHGRGEHHLRSGPDGSMRRTQCALWFFCYQETGRGRIYPFVIGLHKLSSVPGFLTI